jgi:hypothetical protein
MCQPCSLAPSLRPRECGSKSQCKPKSLPQGNHSVTCTHYGASTKDQDEIREHGQADPPGSIGLWDHKLLTACKQGCHTMSSTAVITCPEQNRVTQNSVVNSRVQSCPNHMRQAVSTLHLKRTQKQWRYEVPRTEH